MTITGFLFIAVGIFLVWLVFTGKLSQFLSLTGQALKI